LSEGMRVKKKKKEERIYHHGLRYIRLHVQNGT
jgi:hypothetical protein